MLDFSPVVQRLRAQCSLFRDIDFASNQPEAIEDIKRMPALYLLPANWRAASQRASTGIHIQQVVEQFDLLYFINVTGAMKGTAARSAKLQDTVNAHTSAVWQAIVGWTWDTAYAPISAVSGQLVQLDATRMIFSERFETSGQYRVERSNIYS